MFTSPSKHQQNRVGWKFGVGGVHSRAGSYWKVLMTFPEFCMALRCCDNRFHELVVRRGDDAGGIMTTTTPKVADTPRAKW